MTDGVKIKIKALGIYQIIGGLLGIGLTLFLLGSGTSFSILLFLIILFALGLYAYSIYCGIMLFKKPTKGLTHSKINQFLQVISFFAFGYAFQYLSGVYFLVGIDLTNSFTFNFNFGVSSSWHININTEEPTLLLSINLVAICLIVFIDKVQQKMKNLDLEQQLSFENNKSSTELPNVPVSDTTGVDSSNAAKS